MKDAYTMLRRSFLTASASLVVAPLARPALAQLVREQTLVFVPSAPLTALDPIWTTAAVTRVHGYLIFDSLYGLDSGFVPRPQMAAGHTMESDGLSWNITLRGDLTFHDGQAVRARDCVASLKRWAERSPMGQKLMSVTDALDAPDDTTLRFRLRKPFPQLLQALASVGPQALIMPERLAVTSASQQVSELVGSGPYRFRADEFISGSRAVYERFEGYRPTPDNGSGLTAGPKVAHFARVVWNMIPDAGTATAALQAGEVDWYEQPPPELADLLRHDRNVVVQKLDRFPQVPGLRFNHLQAPFNNPALRRALLPAVNQQDMAIAMVGDDKSLWAENVGVFTPGSPSASQTGLDRLKGQRDISMAKRLIAESGYKGELIRQIAPTDLPTVNSVSLVVADMLKQLGLNNDLVMADWGTVVQRRASREPVDRGGWSVFCTTFSWFEYADPAVNIATRGTGAQAWFGWPDMPELETLRDQWFDAADETSRHALAERIQDVAMKDLPFIPLGAGFLSTAHRKNLTDRIVALPLFWNIRRT